jgi:hypothetical protein
MSPGVKRVWTDAVAGQLWVRVMSHVLRASTSWVRVAGAGVRSPATAGDSSTLELTRPPNRDESSVEVRHDET